MYYQELVNAAAQDIVNSKAVEDIIKCNDWTLIHNKYHYLMHGGMWYGLKPFYKGFKPYADNGNTTAIKCMYYLARYNNNKQFAIINDANLEYYLSLLPCEQLKIFFLEYNEITENICCIGKLIIQKMEEEINGLKKENGILINENNVMKTELSYMPGGAGYKEAKREFNDIAHKK